MQIMFGKRSAACISQQLKHGSDLQSPGGLQATLDREIAAVPLTALIIYVQCLEAVLIFWTSRAGRSGHVLLGT